MAADEEVKRELPEARPARDGGDGERRSSVPHSARGETSMALARRRLLDLCKRHKDELIDDWIENVLALPPERGRYTDRPVGEVTENVRSWLAAFTRILEDGSAELLDQFITHLVEQRYATGYSISGPLIAASELRTAVAGVLDTTHDDDVDPVSSIDVLRAVDALLLQFEHRFAEAYAQRSLFASEERYREIVELSSDVLATIDQEGNLTRLNVRFEVLFGHSRQAWIGRPITALAVAADVPVLRALVMSASHSEAPREATVRCQTRAGLTKVMTVRITRLYGEDASLAVMRDVTEEVARRAQILHSEKLASIGQVAASVAHELNNPMAWVMANLEQIRSGAHKLVAAARPVATGSYEELLRAIDLIDKSCHEALAGVERMRDIVTDLNLFSSSSERKPERVDLVDVIELALRMTGPQLSQLCRIERRYGEMPPLVGYPGKLSQVFVNLFINAAQAMPNRPRDENMVRVTTRFDAGVHHVEVEDNARGMPPEVVERIFDPFFTTKEESARPGIGLWVSRNIVEEQRGTMTVSSQAGVGTTFTIRLTGLDPADLPVPLPPPESPRPSSRGTILFVDDEPMLLNAFARAFEERHEVLVAKSGHEALELLRARGGRIDAIVCDLLMPQMSGMALYDEIGEHFPQLLPKMAFMSGGAFTPSARAFVERVDNPKIAKPISLDDLERVIADLLSSGRQGGGR
ncbi:transcriptional regulator [Sorangium cellulosum]|uniref:histidine kinase n=1 Tax=Sorangium cellulosum TaxID=56 RepID=A0A4P2QBC2_SORCE|nr:ATP-binding protein [Sorangium cellulosum]AUX26955.1 transcriptional regulator [Sorangium cellulosum]